MKYYYDVNFNLTNFNNSAHEYLQNKEIWFRNLKDFYVSICFVNKHIPAIFTFNDIYYN